MKLVARWAQVAAKEVRICQVRAPFWVLLPQEILRAMTAGRSWRSARLLVASTPSWSVKGKEMIALFMESFAHGFFVRFAARRLQQLNGFGLLDGFMMMGVAFLLERSGAVVNSQTVADEDPAEVFSENVA